jgi:hypothetical protein
MKYLLPLLAALAFACTPLPTTPREPEHWWVYIEDEVDADPDLILLFLDEFYADFQITFAPTDFDPECSVASSGGNQICIYARRVVGYLGMAFLDPGNRRKEINCGKNRGVFAATIDGEAGAEYRIAQVAAHEIGHSLGLRHPEENTQGNIMNSYYSATATARFVDDDRDYLFSVLGPR